MGSEAKIQAVAHASTCDISTNVLTLEKEKENSAKLHFQASSFGRNSTQFLLRPAVAFDKVKMVFI